MKSFFATKPQELKPEGRRAIGNVSVRAAHDVYKQNVCPLSFYTFFTVAAFALLFLAQFSTASASLQYLDNNPNYPVSYYHANYREYVDLTSCTFSAEDENYYTYATGYIAYVRDPDGDSRVYRLRQFRQAKNGGENPQFYSNGGKWVSIPAFDHGEISRYIKSHGYMGYIDDYHPYAYYMFKLVYKQTRGVDYPDNLNGDTP